MRLIDADALIDSLGVNDDEDVYCRSVIADAPTFKPERTGKWIHGRELAREMISDCIVAIRYDGWECSECDCLVEQEREPLYKFCPNCGARMKP